MPHRKKYHVRPEKLMSYEHTESQNPRVQRFYKMYGHNYQALLRKTNTGDTEHTVPLTSHCEAQALREKDNLEEILD